MKIQKNWSKETKTYIKGIIEELEKRGLLDNLDESQLMLLAETYELYQLAKKDVEANGLTVTGRQNEVKANPSVNVMLRCQAQILQVSKEFGLTAKSRKKITSTDSENSNSPLSQFLDMIKEEEGD